MGIEAHKWVIHPNTLKRLKEMQEKQKECIDNCILNEDYFIGTFNGMETFLSIVEERKANLIPAKNKCHAETNVSDFTKGNIISAEQYKAEYLEMVGKRPSKHRT